MPRGATAESWTQDRRQSMRKWINNRKPWLESTGPRSVEGKRASAMRSLKSGTRSEPVKQGASVVAALSRMKKELQCIVFGTAISPLI